MRALDELLDAAGARGVEDLDAVAFRAELEARRRRTQAREAVRAGAVDPDGPEAAPERMWSVSEALRAVRRAARQRPVAPGPRRFSYADPDADSISPPFSDDSAGPSPLLSAVVSRFVEPRFRPTV